MATQYFYKNNETLKVVEAEKSDESLKDWSATNMDVILDQLNYKGAILFRHFSIDCVAAFRELVKFITPELEEVYEVPTPRTKIGGHVYTSTNYPPNEAIPLHNELSHTDTWPMKLWFFCLQPSETGGQTPIADSRLIYRNIDEKIQHKFVSKGLRYIRNFSGERGEMLSWKDVYRVKNKEDAEWYFTQNNINFEWLNDDKLKTIRERKAVEQYSLTQEIAWFNQAHIFHHSNMEKKLSQFMANAIDNGKEFMPYDTTFGDGSPIAEEELDHIRDVIKEAEILFDWQQHDVLLLNNVLCMHGRKPFTGGRQVVVSMAQKSQ